MLVIINGASCSGKSSIAREICKQSEDRFVHLQVDEAKKYLFTILDHNSTPREIGRPICDEILLQTAKIFLKNKKNVVIDTVFDGDNAKGIAKLHLDFFKNEKVFFIGIDCELEERLNRFNLENDNPKRSKKTIIAQENVFELCKVFYNKSFDSTKMLASEIAERILQKINVRLSVKLNLCQF